MEELRSQPPEAVSEPGDPAAPEVSPGVLNPAAQRQFDRRLAEIRHREARRTGRRNLWLAHHWPGDYAERCVRLGDRWVCRRCSALYPLGLLVAFLSAGGLAPWPEAWDPWPVWLLSLPATVAYVGEQVDLVRYRPRWQVATTLLAAVAFGRALGYELEQRWQPIFWGPIATFGGIWFLATAYRAGYERSSRSGGPRSGPGRPEGGRRAGVPAGAQRAATARSSSSSVL